MRHAGWVLLLIAVPSLAQRPRPLPRSGFADQSEGNVKQAMEMFVPIKKMCDRDIEVLAHLRAADNALVDPMQPSNAIQKAIDEVDAASRLEQDKSQGPPEFLVMQGISKVQAELQSAKLSPMTADFPHLRATLREYALGPASRVAVRDASALQAETMAWLRVQQLISEHVRIVAEETGAVLRASEGQ